MERDIDLLIAEELRVNASFGEWVMSRFNVSVSLVFPAIATNVSDVQDGSEADVVAIFRTEGGDYYRLFVEDKIDAGLMPLQLERYVRRGTAEVARGDIVGFSVLFFTPSIYRKISLPDGVVQMTFESAATYFRSVPQDTRAQYRASFLEKAVPVIGPTARDAGVVETEPYIKAWWDAVYAMLDRDFPRYFSHRTRYPRSVYFAPETPGQAKYLRVDFKGHKGEVDLAFKNVDFAALKGILEQLDNAPGTLVSNGRSSALRVAGLETFVISEGLAIIDSKVRTAYEAAHSLLTFWQANRSVFDAALGLHRN